MKKIKAVKINIKYPTWGKVTRLPSWSSSSKSNMEYAVTRKGHLFFKNELSIVASEESYEKLSGMSKPACLIDKQDFENISIGDIIFVTTDRQINFLYEIKSPHNVLFVTDKCNLKCVMCPQPPFTGESQATPVDLVELIKLMSPKDTKHIAMSGGEPTLNETKFLSLISACKEKLPKTPLMVLTNGKKFSDVELARSMALIGHPCISFGIPLYSDIDDIHDGIVGVKGSFYDVISGLYNLAKVRANIEIRTVVHAGTVDRLPHLASFIYRNLPFVSHVAIMGFEATGSARTNIESLWIDPFDTTPALLEAARILKRSDIYFSLYNHQLCVLPDALRPFSKRSISGWKNTYIDECTECSKRDECGGFFETGMPYYSKHIKAFLL